MVESLLDEFKSYGRLPKKIPKAVGKGLLYAAVRRYPFALATKSVELPLIGDYDKYEHRYATDYIVQAVIDIPSSYAMKSGWRILGEKKDEKHRKKIEEFFDSIDFARVGYIWLKDSKIYGTGILEFPKEHNNLIARNPKRFRLFPDKHGKLVKVEQWVYGKGDKRNPIFKPENIVLLVNNPLSSTLYGISDIEALDYLIQLKDFAERDIASMLNKYAGDRFDISCGTEDSPMSPSAIGEIRDAFNKLKFGEDIVHSHTVSVDVIEGSAHAPDFIEYLNYIIDMISISAKIPFRSFFTGQKSTDAQIKKQTEIFEAHIRTLQASMEFSINTQIIPTLIPSSAKSVKFRFNTISVETEYDQAKTLHLYLLDKVITPQEVREKYMGLPADYSGEPLGAEEETKDGVQIESKGVLAKKQKAIAGDRDKIKERTQKG